MNVAGRAWRCRHHRLAPLTGVSTGSRRDWRFGGAALLVGTTRRAHALLLVAQCHGQRIPPTPHRGRHRLGQVRADCLHGGAVPALPAGHGGRVRSPAQLHGACLAMGGDWIELGGKGHGVQPLRAVDRPEELAWAHDWVLKALCSRGLEVQPHTEAAVTEALGHVADLPPEQRTLTRLQASWPATMPPARRCRSISTARAPTACCSTAWSRATAKRR